ncbi:MAG: sigma-54 dependent transcriptional regulator [Gammaproteobacteria bacterium]|nr:sigma-54 dependent transcriptional regulator [Gammaproteobacteria bacterium]
MKVLVVDDEPNLRRMLRAPLRREGFAIAEAGTAGEGLARMREDRADAILLDLVLPGTSGLEALSRFRKRWPDVPIVMMSGQATIADAVQATRDGAFHFLEKPFTPEAVLATLRAALELRRARTLSRILEKDLGPGADLVGASHPMERVRETIRRVAPTDARVLIVGESGTGKELAATAIHGLSPRRRGPFVRVNSAAIPRELVESEMFGHERGAFTGADRRRQGRFELAHLGTLFLDEVGDLDTGAQGKLLRAIESGSVERVGGGAPVAVDVRVLAATNRDLGEETRRRRFREDLFFRLNVVPVAMPPLRERIEDLPLLVEHIAERLRRRHGLSVPEISEEAMDAMARHSWPGNVRELLNLLERLAILHAGGHVRPGDIVEFLDHPRQAGAVPAYVEDDPRSLSERMDGFEAEVIRGALAAARGNMSEAARKLRTDRANLYRRIRRLGLRKPG